MLTWVCLKTACAGLEFPLCGRQFVKTARRDFGDVVVLRSQIASQNTAKWDIQNSTMSLGTMSFQAHPKRKQIKKAFYSLSLQ